jgi:hypothetical protein
MKTLQTQAQIMQPLGAVETFTEPCLPVAPAKSRGRRRDGSKQSSRDKEHDLQVPQLDQAMACLSMSIQAPAPSQEAAKQPNTQAQSDMKQEMPDPAKRSRRVRIKPEPEEPILLSATQTRRSHRQQIKQEPDAQLEL